MLRPMCIKLSPPPKRGGVDMWSVCSGVYSGGRRCGTSLKQRKYLLRPLSLAYSQRQWDGQLLHGLCRFEKAPIGEAMPFSEQHPMDHLADELGVGLAQNPPRIAATPFVHQGMALPHSKQYLHLPAHAHYHQHCPPEPAVQPSWSPLGSTSGAGPTAPPPACTGPPLP